MSIGNFCEKPLLALTGEGKGKSHIRSVRWGVSIREDTCPKPLAFEVGRPVPFLAAFISSVLPPGPHSLLGRH